MTSHGDISYPIQNSKLTCLFGGAMKRKDYAIITAMVMGASLATSATATQAQPNQSTAAKHANTSVASVKPSGPQTVTATKSSKAAGTRTTASTITCTLDPRQYVHDSHHVNGTTNYVATASCDANVSSVAVTATIHPPVPYKAITGTQRKSTRYVTANAAYDGCHPGKQYGTAVMSVKFPAGYSPSTSTKSGTGQVKSLNCN